MKMLRFEGSGSEYFKIWIVNILLTIITLGLYYPWAKVRNLRYFYGNSLLEDRSFDYHATGKQLFKAYLIAMGLFIVYVIVQQVSPIGSFVLLGVLFLAIPWVIWRSMMFSMRMTSFSNVRFGFVGKLGQAYVNFLLLPLLLIICIYVIPFGAVVGIPYLTISKQVFDSSTIGVVILIIFLTLFVAAYIFALIKQRNAMYLINGTTYGQGHFSAELDVKEFLKIMMKTIGLSIVTILGFFIAVSIFSLIVVGFENLQNVGEAMENPEGFEELINSGVIYIIALVYFLMFIFGFIVTAYNRSRQRNYIVGNIQLDGKITLQSTLKARSLAWVMVSNLLIVIFTFGLGFPWAKVRMARLILENTHVDTEAGFDDYVTQQQSYQSSLGDQIGDAFDVDIGLAI